MNFFHIYRNVVFGLIFILNFPVLGLSAFWTQHTVGGASSFGLGIFTSCVSMFVFPVLLLLPIFRKNAFISYVVSEIVIISMMWLFWMVSMILAIQNACILDSGCQSLFAVQGLDIFIFILRTYKPCQGLCPEILITCFFHQSSNTSYT
ncbi:hypothetical protein CPB84DRAFT_558407 [Gymnopilus junonius]|uniref:MARVEL domain-containing protein n=1 Tax=Gymnopilus junonius TaxID=109634 RepID=A0A9P5THB0_GYMJU|nr:hypothetical protein CPB84DRAFT_558407 [Gymnopilus junonius]